MPRKSSGASQGVRRVTGSELDQAAYMEIISQESALAVFPGHFPNVAIGVTGEAGMTV